MATCPPVWAWRQRGRWTTWVTTSGPAEPSASACSSRAHTAASESASAPGRSRARGARASASSACSATTQPRTPAARPALSPLPRYVQVRPACVRPLTLARRLWRRAHTCRLMLRAPHLRLPRLPPPTHRHRTHPLPARRPCASLLHPVGRRVFAASRPRRPPWPACHRVPLPSTTASWMWLGPAEWVPLPLLLPTTCRRLWASRICGRTTVRR